MEIKGKIILDLGAVSGTSKAGNNWKKHEYVLETQETYPKKVHFDFFGDNADRYQLNVGDDVTLSFDIESREYNGRWYTSIRGWKVDKDNGVAAADPAAPAANGIPAPPMPEFTMPGNSDEDIPF